jgi:serine/threonine-protein kinase
MNARDAVVDGVGALRPGASVGPYELLRPLAQGGMGAVWAARLSGSRGFQQVVALKLLLPRPDALAEAEAMFLDEARVAARIEHLNVGQILDFGEDRGTLYLAMEWIDGAALSRVRSEHARRTNRPLPDRWVLSVVSAACAGLHAAHELRGDDGEPLALVHRDVTPQNVMVGFDGFVKLVDFGVAKSAARLCVTRALGTVKGKIAYLSPEQLRGASLDRRSDLFTLGAMLYTMLTNVHPFRGTTDEETLRAIARAAPRPIRETCPRVGADVAAIVERCLSRDPGQRFATAAEVGAALERAVLARGGRVADDEVGALVRALFDAPPRSFEPTRVAGRAVVAEARRHGEETADTVPGLDEAAARRLFAEAESGDDIEIDVELDLDEPAPAPPAPPAPTPLHATTPTEPPPPTITTEPSLELPLEGPRLGRAGAAVLALLAAVLGASAFAAKWARSRAGSAPPPVAIVASSRGEPPAPPAPPAPSDAAPREPQAAETTPPHTSAEPSARAPSERPPRTAVRGHPTRRRP